MAFSATVKHRDVEGSLQVLYYDLDFASVTSGTIVTSLTHVVHADFINGVTDDQGVVKLNSDGSNATPGSVNVSGVTSSDTGSIRIVGR